MKRSIQGVLLALLAVPFPGVLKAHGQAGPTATQTLRVSVFGGATGTFTGLDSGRNVGITAGVDVGFRPLFRLYPSFELRGTYPIDKGNLNNQKNLLGGIKLGHPVGRRLTPYGDILAGRGAIDYSGVYIAPGQGFYLETTSTVYAGGLGLDYWLSNSFSLKADGQFQRYDTPVTASGHVYAKAITVGMVYRPNFNLRRHHLGRH